MEPGVCWVSGLDPLVATKGRSEPGMLNIELGRGRRSTTEGRVCIRSKEGKLRENLESPPILYTEYTKTGISMSAGTCAAQRGRPLPPCLQMRVVCVCAVHAVCSCVRVCKTQIPAAGYSSGIFAEPSEIPDQKDTLKNTKKELVVLVTGTIINS